VLCRIEDDSSLTPIADGVKVASFAAGRIGYPEWALRSGRLEYIHSIDDRYEHDIDELMAWRYMGIGSSERGKQ
jgi:hypothetical protein